MNGIEEQDEPGITSLSHACIHDADIHLAGTATSAPEAASIKSIRESICI
jgi:hypothetical protein